MKQIEDGQQIRRALVNCFERASLPGLTDEQKEKILSFVVVGAGPAGAFRFFGENKYYDLCWFYIANVFMFTCLFLSIKS